MPTWTPALAIGVAAVDEQHQELFTRADVLLAAMRGGKPAEEVKPLLEFLDDYCARHFASEEKLMRERGYPGLAEHLEQHRAFVSQFDEIVASFQRKGAAPTVTIALQQLVCGWLVKHVGTVDKKLAQALGAQPARTTL